MIQSMHDYSDNTNTLLFGDSAVRLRELEDNSIDLTVTSPPYDKLRTYNGIVSSWSFEKFQAIAKELFRVTKEGGGSRVGGWRCYC